MPLYCTEDLGEMTKAQKKAAARLECAAKVVIYARVSTEEQAESGAGLEAQLAECRAYAARHGLEVVAEIEEPAVSGKVPPASRKAFSRALEILDACEAGGLLVRRTDRISRRLRHMLVVVDRAVADGWWIATTDGKLDTSSAAGRLQINVMAAVAEHEREVIGERTREGLAAKRAQGVILGRPRVLSNAVIQRIADERDDGRSMGAIAAGLTADGIPTARWRIPQPLPVWGVSTIRAVLVAHELAMYGPHPDPLATRDLGA